MQRIIKTKSGIYVLEICAEEKFELQIKQYTHLIFDKGYYYYVGSAQKNFYHRIKRHLKSEKKIYWHIDHLLNIPTNRIKTVYVLKDYTKENECKLVLKLLDAFKLNHPANKFGNSDCKNCISHLLFSRKKISHNQFSALYQSIVRLIPSSKDIS